MMVGGIDKQIYLPYQLAQNLGFYKKYGVNMQLSTEQTGGVGAETAMVSGQVDMAGAWYVHTIDFQAKGKDVIDVVQLSGAPGEREMCAKGSGVTSPAHWKGKTRRRHRHRLGHRRPHPLPGRPVPPDHQGLQPRRGRRRPHLRRRAAARPDRLRHDHPADRRRDPEAGHRLLRDRPRHHQRRAAVAGRRLPGRRRAGPAPTGWTRTRPRCRRSSTRWSPPCTGSPPTARPTSPTRMPRVVRLQRADHQGRLHRRTSTRTRASSCPTG